MWLYSVMRQWWWESEIKTRCWGHARNLNSKDSVHSTCSERVVKILFRSRFLSAKWIDLGSTTFWIVKEIFSDIGKMSIHVRVKIPIRWNYLHRHILLIVSTRTENCSFWWSFSTSEANYWLYNAAVSIKNILPISISKYSARNKSKFGNMSF